MTFEHGCASGDPLPDRVCLWTRVTAEDPSVRAMFEDELAKRGLTSLMPDEVYTDPGYVWKK